MKPIKKHSFYHQCTLNIAILTCGYRCKRYIMHSIQAYTNIVLFFKESQKAFNLVYLLSKLVQNTSFLGPIPANALG